MAHGRHLPVKKYLLIKALLYHGWGFDRFLSSEKGDEMAFFKMGYLLKFDNHAITLLFRHNQIARGALRTVGVPGLYPGFPHHLLNLGPELEGLDLENPSLGLIAATLFYGRIIFRPMARILKTYVHKHGRPPGITEFRHFLRKYRHRYPAIPGNDQKLSRIVHLGSPAYWRVAPSKGGSGEGLLIIPYTEEK